jgi:hypothetical protein
MLSRQVLRQCPRKESPNQSYRLSMRSFQDNARRQGKAFRLTYWSWGTIQRNIEWDEAYPMINLHAENTIQYDQSLSIQWMLIRIEISRLIIWINSGFLSWDVISSTFEKIVIASLSDLLNWRFHCVSCGPKCHEGWKFVRQCHCRCRSNYHNSWHWPAVLIFCYWQRECCMW